MAKFSKPKKIILHFALSFCFLIFAFCIMSVANAAEFRVESESATFGVGDEFLVTLVVDTEGESINAFAGHVVFPQELLELKGIREKGSIVNLWVAEPLASPSQGGPSFSGLTPG